MGAIVRILSLILIEFQVPVTKLNFKHEFMGRLFNKLTHPIDTCLFKSFFIVHLAAFKKNSNIYHTSRDLFTIVEPYVTPEGDNT
jgi:hypothetical protein